MRYGTVMRLMSLMVLPAVLLQVAAGVPRRSQTRHSDSDKSVSDSRQRSDAGKLAGDFQFKYVQLRHRNGRSARLPTEEHMSVARKGYEGVLTKISLDSDGLTNIADICEGTNVADLAYYFARKRNSNDFHGLGAFLIMNEKFISMSGKGKSKTIQRSASGN